MVQITGSADDRRYARDVAQWCARELAAARQTGDLETRPFVQNADLIIAALLEYAVKPSDDPSLPQSLLNQTNHA